ncbi:MAG TPA: NADH-ubiquinone oxidoreductase-F iron-sulfur binding region domain-containing protein [Acidimicrobiales bacterium]|nr:NADH-ubiquinone oxidoreductase-F iron-sulfur binding region domain-containing protein [Acidimicrobiales bacterium]
MNPAAPGETTRERAHARDTAASQPALFGVAGAPGTRLLAGPARSAGTESLAQHLARLGVLDLDAREPARWREIVRESGLLGRGGAGFSTVTKLDVAASAPGAPLVVVNASEGEPASRKDRTLLELRPHLVLDGAALAARAVGADEIVVYLHREHLRSAAALDRAVAERGAADPSGARIRVVDAPARYIAGETSAVVSYLSGTGALPQRRAVPVAHTGVAQRPTVVNNAETLAHLALVGRFGATWFRQAGTPEAPGSTLITLTGAVTVPGVVVEVMAPVALGRVLETIGGLDAVPRAVLLGGYEGTWLSGEIAWRAPLDRHLLGASGSSLGCGLVAVLAQHACGLAETSRLFAWLADQSAGQCGPCVLGLPALAQLLDDVVAGTARRRDIRELHELAASVRGRGACGHPTGAVTLLESALETFTPELKHHLRGDACTTVSGLGQFPLPRESMGTP